MVHGRAAPKQDLNRVVTWIPRTADGTPPAGSGVWPRNAGFLTGYGSSHYHFVPDYWCPHILVRGRGTIRLARKEYRVMAGDCFSLWPGVPIEYFEDADDPWEFYWMHLGGGGAEAYVRACGFHRDRMVFRAASPAKARRTFAAIYDSYVAGKPDSPFSVLSGMYALAPLMTAPKEDDGLKVNTATVLIERASAILDSMPQKAWSVRQLARALHIDRSTLFRCMQSVGEQPGHFIIRRKIEQAKRFLELTEAKLSVIAHGAGFRSDKYFIRVFREQTGETPSRYRRRIREIFPGCDITAT